MDEKVLEEIRFHTDTVEADANSPLHLIREKEMEISGQVLAVKREAEEIVAEARKAAVEATKEAEEEGARLAAEQEARILAEVEKKVAQVESDNVKEIETLHEVVAERKGRAAEFVVGTVTSR